MTLRRFEVGLTKLMPWLYLGIVVLATSVLTGLAAFAYTQHQDLRKHQRILAQQQQELHQQQQAMASLAQNLCKRVSTSRDESNREIREPLRATDEAISRIFAGFAAQSEPEQKQALLALSVQFSQYAKRVKLAEKIPCAFAGIAAGGGGTTLKPKPGQPG